jgi:hypothetical protein
MNKQIMNLQKVINKSLGFLDNKNTLYGVLIFLVLYSALFVNMMPKLFISFIDSMIGKIITILLIIIIGMKSRAISLLLALAFVITLQRAQMLRMNGNLVELRVMEKLNNKQEEEEEVIESLDSNEQGGVSTNIDDASSSSPSQTTLTGQKKGTHKEEFQNFMGSLFGDSSKEKPVNMVLGYNSDTDCSMNCGKNVDGQCSPVETYNGEYDPQGLNCMSNVGGYVDSLGYPF